MKQKYDVIGMSCAACVNAVNNAVKKIDGVIECNVSLLSNSMNVVYDESKASDEKIIKAVKGAGYKAKIKVDLKTKNDKEYTWMIYRLIISFVFLTPLFYFSMGEMLNLPIPSFLVGNDNCIKYFILLLFLTIPILIVNGKFFIKGYKCLFKLNPNMDTLVAIGSTASFIYATVSFILGCVYAKAGDARASEYLQNKYFDSSGMILTLVTLGKLFESRAKGKTTSSIDKLVQLMPEEVKVLIDGIEVTKKIENVNLNDLVIVKMGNRVPVDGEVVKGEATIDTSLMTGESIPVYVSSGDKVISSSLVLNGSLLIKATSRGTDSSMQKLIDLVSEAADSKAPISRIADRASKVFVPVVMLISLITFLIWWLILGDIANAFKYGISVLVISCPCALGLATPVAIMVSVGKFATFGVISKSAEAIEVASSIDTVILDKTGTITKGEPEVVDIRTYDGESEKDLIDIVYSLEKGMVHPLSNAIVKYGNIKNANLLNVNEYEYFGGKGIRGKINDVMYYVGNLSFIESITKIKEEVKSDISELSNQGKTPLIIAKTDSVVGIICVIDELKNSSIQAVKEFNNLGIHVVMATGDNKKTALAIANRVGIVDVRDSILPHEKEMVVKEYQEMGKKVAMIGDGINDSLALVNSDLGIAIGAGSDVAIDYADMILIKSDLLDAVNSIRLARRTLLTIKINLFWAFFYNIICIPIACGLLSGFGITLNPMVASLAMSFSSVFVVLTALTINNFKVIKSMNNEINNETKEEIIDNEDEEDYMKVVVKVDDMHCEHCAARVKDAILEINNVKRVKINLETKEVKIVYRGELDLERVKVLVNDAGYKYLG